MVHNLRQEKASTQTYPLEMRTRYADPLMSRHRDLFGPLRIFIRRGITLDITDVLAAHADAHSGGLAIRQTTSVPTSHRTCIYVQAACGIFVETHESSVGPVDEEV